MVKMLPHQANDPRGKMDLEMPGTPVERVQDLCRAVRMLAVIGASLKLRSTDASDPAIRYLVDVGAEMSLGANVASLDAAEIGPLLTMIGIAFAEGGELLSNPQRAGGWKVPDAQLLQSMGRASRSAFDRIHSLAETRPLLRDSLRGTFLDVGTGVGGIALRATETCPDLRVDAIDLWEFALDLAERNVAGSPYARRIQLSRLDVRDLQPGPRYTIAWLPTMFMTRSVVEDAIDRIRAASCRGAWLVASLYTKPDDPFMETMSMLRTLRGGGEIMDPAELGSIMQARGYVDVEVDVAPIATFVLGRLPENPLGTTV